MNGKKIKSLLLIAVFILTTLAISIPTSLAGADDHPSIGFYALDSTAVWTADPDTSTLSKGFVIEIDTVTTADDSDWAMVRVYVADSGITLGNLLNGINMPTFDFINTVLGSNENMLQLELYFESPDGNGWLELSMFPYTSAIKENITVDATPLAADWITSSKYDNDTFAVYYAILDDGSSFDNDTGSMRTEDLIDDALANAPTAGDHDDWLLTRVGVGIGWVAVNDQTVLVDNIKIAGVTYNLEPFELDAEYYNIDSTVTVTVFNMTLNEDSIRVDEHPLIMTAVSDTAGDSIDFDLVEDGVNTGIFVGTFTVVDADPAVDELLIESVDEIQVSYDIGVELTATVDTEPPEVTGMSPADGDLISNNLTAVQVSVTGHVLAWMTVDGIVRDTATDSEPTMTYTVTDVDPLFEGEHTAVVIAEDAAGNVNTTSWSFTVDITEPTCTITMDPESPVNATVVEFLFEFNEDMYNESTIVIDGNATDYMTDPDPDYEVWEDLRVYFANYTVDTGFNGSVIIAISGAEDIAGNEITATDFTFYIDSVNPTAPGELAETALVNSIILDWEASEDLGSGVASYNIYKDDALIGSVDHPTTTYTDTGLMASATFNYEVGAVDFAGNELKCTALEVDFVLGDVTEWEISLEEGWNLVSLPLIPDDSSIEVVLADILVNVTSVWSYDEATEGWSSYAPGSPSDLSDMVDGDGYWVMMSSAATLTVYGDEMPEPPAMPPTYDLFAGWNLIGYKGLEAMNASVYLGDAVADDCIRIYGFDDGSYFGVSMDEPLEPGLGYWIAMAEAGTIYP